MLIVLELTNCIRTIKNDMVYIRNAYQNKKLNGITETNIVQTFTATL